MSICFWKTTRFGKSVDVIREEVTMSLSMSCSQLSLDVDVCNLLILVADAFISLINVDHTCMRKTSFPQKCQISSRALHNYSVITLGLLASTFKVHIGFALVILLARHERTGYNEELLGDDHAS